MYSPNLSESNTVSFDAQGLRLDTGEQAEIICEQLYGKNVEVLILQGNTFGIEAAERVGLELANHSNLREAHFKDLFTSRGREEVPLAMSHLLEGINNSGAKLTLLDLSDNAIGPIGAPSVIEFLNSSSADTLETLLINNCGLGPEGSTSIAASIPRLKNLRTFICGRNRLENKGATNVSRALKELRNLEVLSFKQNGIFVEGIKQLASVLEANKDTLKEFDLSDNTVKSEGGQALADVISKSSNLHTVRIDDALLGNEGFKKICEGFSKSPSIKSMRFASFEGNELKGNKLVDLIESTFVNNFDEEFELDLLENEFNVEQMMRLQSFNGRIQLLVDEIDSNDGSQDEDEEEDGDEELEEGEYDGESDDVSNGYVDFGDMETEIREITHDFISKFHQQPFDAEEANRTFHELISTTSRPKNPNASSSMQENDENSKDFQAVQILCEELGLIKSEIKGKKKTLERDAIVYIGKNIEELTPVFRNFFSIIVTNNDELECGKLLFEKF